MSLRVRCPKCKQVFEFDEPAAAGVIECAYCHQRMKWSPKVPKAAPAPPEEPAAPPEPAAPVESSAPAEPWPPADLAPVKLIKLARVPMPAKRTNPALIIGIVAVGVVVVGMAGTIAYLLTAGPGTTPTPTPAAPPIEVAAKTTPDATKTPVVSPQPPVPAPPTPAPPTPATRPATSAVDLDAAALFAKASPCVVRIEIMKADFTKMGQGSGFLVSSDGVIVTNHHVMRAGRKGMVLFGDEKAYPVAAVLAQDEKKDLAVIKINATDMPYLELFPKDKKPEIGARAFAIGTPVGYTNTLSEGLVSGLRDQENRSVVQTTAPISSGSSGGPLLDAKARVIGVNTYVHVEHGGGSIVENINFAVASKEVRELLTRAMAAKAKLPPATAGKPLDKESVERLTKAYEHVSKSQWLDAAVVTKELRTKNPENVEVLLLGAFLALKMNQPDEAQETYKKIVETDPNEAEGHLGLGLVYNQKKMWREAEEVLSRAAKLRPEDASVQHAYGQALLELGRKDEALSALKESTRLDPEDPDAWLVLGQAYLAQKLLSPARDAFRTVIRHRPDNALAYAYLAVVEYQNGQIDEAHNAAGRALHIQPGCAIALHVLGLTYVHKKDWENARKALGALETVDPKLFKELQDEIKAKGGDPTPLKGDLPKKEPKKDDAKKGDGKEDGPKTPGPEPKKPKK